ncbi:MAG: class I SAM-dependent methyltransferase [Kiloniellales bacterium]|nr:class I SAM-dependent methyltransferase [Kiloniellales bacterium]
MSATGEKACRFCGAALTQTFVDLGETPLANSYLSEADLARPEPRYPLHARVCQACFLVQVASVVPPEEIFGDYAYFSSYSTTWVEHAKRFAKASIARFALDADSRVVEVASNDGYLLRHFVAAGIPVLGVEPAGNVAAAAQAVGVPTEVRFFGQEVARDLVAREAGADLLVANNVLAHVPDLNDFVAGLRALLNPAGVLSVEFPHLLRLIEQVQFDTIYHEHFCYFSFLSVEQVFNKHGLLVFDVERLSTHGGSLRVLACRGGGQARAEGPAVEDLRRLEHARGLDRLDTYDGFAAKVAAVKEGLVRFLRDAKAEGKNVVAYGAAAKGNTLLNTCGIDEELIAYAVDRNPHKQSHYLPGSHLPICPPQRVFETKPDYLLILPWNLRDEIVASMADIRAWGGRFVIPIPEVEVC